MMTPGDIHKLLDETIRHERGWLIASLVSRLGPSRVDLAEDVAQDAIVKALSTWPYKGVPDNPRAWLRRVAGNVAIDRLRRSARELGLDETHDLATTDETIVTPSLSDPELDLIVLCCDPALSAQDQMILALKTVSGFTAAETGALLFLKPDTLAQRLARAKRHLRGRDGEVARFPTRFALKDRMPLVLKVIYLMFAWGHLPRRGETLVRTDLCREAIRLSDALLSQKGAPADGHHALQALMLFQASRLPARLGPEDELMTLETQDRDRWDRDLVHNAFWHLQIAQEDETVTRYHIEAGIAALHAQAANWSATDWPAIARLYETLTALAPSPAVAINHAVACIEIGEDARAEQLLDAAAQSSEIAGHAAYYLAQARLAEARDQTATAQDMLAKARTCQTSAPVATFIDRQWQALANST